MYNVDMCRKVEAWFDAKQFTACEKVVITNENKTAVPIALWFVSMNWVSFVLKSWHRLLIAKSDLIKVWITCSALLEVEVIVIFRTWFLKRCWTTISVWVTLPELSPWMPRSRGTVPTAYLPWPTHWGDVSGPAWRTSMRPWLEICSGR